MSLLPICVGCAGSPCFAQVTRLRQPVDSEVVSASLLTRLRRRASNNSFTVFIFAVLESTTIVGGVVLLWGSNIVDGSRRYRLLNDPKALQNPSDSRLLLFLSMYAVLVLFAPIRSRISWLIPLNEMT